MSWKLKDLEESLLIGSTLIEGSTLSEEEARAVLSGRTVQGHPISEIRELLNYRAAVEWLMKQFEATPYLSLDLILQFHQRLFSGMQGAQLGWKGHRNYTYLSDGSRHDYLSPGDVPKAMAAWVVRFNTANSNEVSYSEGVELYYAFQEIHPFADGNGRIGRILLAYWLHWKLRQSLQFYLKDKVAHLRALEARNRGDLKLLGTFFKARIRKEKK